MTPSSPPILLADRTPIVLTTERLASLPPPGSAAATKSEALDTVVLVGVWLLLGACVVVLAAGAVVLGMAALAGGTP